MSSSKAMSILGSGVALCAAVNGARGFAVPNATNATMNATTDLFSNNSTAWTEDLLSTNATSTMFNNSSRPEDLGSDKVSVVMRNDTNNATAFLPHHEYLNQTTALNGTIVNNNSTLSFVNGTANATSDVVDFPCGKTLADGFDQQAPATLRVSAVRGPINYDISGKMIHQVPVESNSTNSTSEFLTSEVLFNPEELVESQSNYTAFGNDGLFHNSNNTCAHCELDDNVVDSVAVMSSFVSGQMKENGTAMNGLVAIVADVSTDVLRNFTIANVTDAWTSLTNMVSSSQW